MHVQLGVFLVLPGTHARFYKELDREMSNKRRFSDNFTQDCLGSQKYIKCQKPIIPETTFLEYIYIEIRNCQKCVWI